MARVMVVDDAYSELQLMESILRSAGHEVIPLTDGDRLEDRVAAERPDVVLLDVVMPRRNGFDALRATSAPGPRGWWKTRQGDRVRGPRRGADDCVGKPFTAEQPLAAVRRFAR